MKILFFSLPFFLYAYTQLERVSVSIYLFCIFLFLMFLQGILFEKNQLFHFDFKNKLLKINLLLTTWMIFQRRCLKIFFLYLDKMLNHRKKDLMDTTDNGKTKIIDFRNSWCVFNNHHRISFLGKRGNYLLIRHDDHHLHNILL